MLSIRYIFTSWFLFFHSWSLGVLPWNTTTATVAPSRGEPDAGNTDSGKFQWIEEGLSLLKKKNKKPCSAEVWLSLCTLMSFGWTLDRGDKWYSQLRQDSHVMILEGLTGHQEKPNSFFTSLVWLGEKNAFLGIYAKWSCFIHHLVEVTLEACRVDDVSFSISAESNLTEPFGICVRGWGNQAEEGMVPIPVH